MLVKDHVLANLEQLPENLQLEILHYSEYLVSRYITKKITPSTAQSSLDDEHYGYGSLKGKIIMSEDFDEALQDLAEYMS